MSVVADFPVIQRPWKGYADPGLPVGMWIAQGSILGDASGTAMSIIFVFKGEGEPLGGRYYNIEQLEVHTTDDVRNDGGLQIVNFDIVGSTGLITRTISLRLKGDDVTLSALEPGFMKFPIFLGRPQLVDLEAQVLIRTANDDGETFFATAQGYIWEPRSLLVDGGLRRPVDSLYG